MGVVSAEHEYSLTKTNVKHDRASPNGWVTITCFVPALRFSLEPKSV